VATIWVVDDEEPVREVLGAMLQQLGHETRLFPDADALLKAYHPGVTDVVLTDFRMPGMDGLTLIRNLRAKDARVVIMMLTGFPSVQDAVEAVRLGASDYLSKPFRMEEIRMRLARALDVRDLQQSLRRSRILAWLLIGSMPFWFGLGLALRSLLGSP
jgi:two-component system response regulator PilR (NtrC family)